MDEKRTKRPAQSKASSRSNAPARGKASSRSNAPARGNASARSNAPARGNAPTRRRRRMNLTGSLLYVAFVIGCSVLLAIYGWTLANDVLALNKAERSATITLPDEHFKTREEKIEVEDEDGNVTTKTVVVTEADLGYVADQLKEKGIVEKRWLFKLFATVTNSDRKIRAGTYTLDASMDYLALVTNMGSSSANRATVDVTFVEGSTLDQIFEQMQESGVSTVAQLRNMAANHDYAFSFLQDIPLGDYHRLEGYLFPDTYTFYLNEDPKYAINKMLVNFDARFTDEMREQVAQSDYSIHEVLTIASLIEKETDGTDERKIASVIYNRLENPSRETAGYLNIDASIYYVTGRIVTKEDYQGVDSPYNTYLHKGLPPGPIANPGMASIQAAMDPENTGYYYYVLNPETNRHEYSKTYEQHVQKVNRYAGE